MTNSTHWPRITLLTDFGTADGYAAAMRGAIAARLPAAIIDDASHDIPFGDVIAAQLALERYWDVYPVGTVHVVVVDPGVGGARRAIAVQAAGRTGVGPDNGVLEPMLAQATAVYHLTETTPLSQRVAPTFHGRDIFAPAAAWLAAGGRIQKLGSRIDDAIRLPIEKALREGADFTGRVIHVDRFGNLITNIRPDSATAFQVEIEGQRVPHWGRTYADVASGEALGLIGSAGYVEIAVRDGSAAEVLGLRRGARVRLVAR
jgi:S-adenosylmethionine hydrolase